MEKTRLPRAIRLWLLTGVVMVFFQVVIGGVTRLTDSGLSITEWAVIQGTFPPLNETEWLQAFSKYKAAAKKQYETLHAGMTLKEFKFIFFWEYAHRLWARLMGFVFLFPFLFFLWKKRMQRWLLRRLGVVIGLAALAAVFGWIMVASGLNDDRRTWVSAYKLVIHLAIATSLFGYLFWTWLRASQPQPTDAPFADLRRTGWVITVVLFIQIVFGGLMAGMRAGLIHPHFPIFINGEYFWAALKSMQEDGMENLVDYEPHLFAKAVVQVLHRSTAWILTALVVFFYIKLRKKRLSNTLKNGTGLLILVLIVQTLLGIFTVINSVGRIPILFGVLHQAGALILFATMLFVNYHCSGLDKK